MSLAATLSKSLCFCSSLKTTSLPESSFDISVTVASPPPPAYVPLFHRHAHPHFSRWHHVSLFVVRALREYVWICVCVYIKARSWHQASSATLVIFCFSSRGLFLKLELMILDELASSCLHATSAGITGICCHAGLLTWVLRCELRSLCSHSKSLTFWATCPACDLIVVSHCANSQCLLLLNGQENWYTMGDKLLRFETTFWVQFSHDEPCHCRTMRGFSTFLNFSSKYDTIIITTLWSFECFKRDNVFSSNGVVKNSFKLVILFWIRMLLEFSESFMGVAEFFRAVASVLQAHVLNSRL